jgi:phytol kinase
VNDIMRGAVWAGVLGFGLGAVVLLYRRGLPRTYARDVLHVAAGIWILGWPWWNGWVVPVVLSGALFAALAAVPLGRRHCALVRRVHDSVAGDGERWGGVVVYAGSFAVLTTFALAGKLAHPAVCGAAALCMGDGVGGLLGRRFGRHCFKVPWSKAKTWEGTVAVAAFSTLGILLMHAALSMPVRMGSAILLGLVSAAAEALAPRAWDNAWVPAAVGLAGSLLP